MEFGLNATIRGPQSLSQVGAPSGLFSPTSGAPVTRRNSHTTATPLVIVSKLGRARLILIKTGPKINGSYYREVVLKHGLLPAMRHLSGETFIFQQDNVPAHCPRDTVEFLKREVPSFITPDLWPPKSSYHIPVDYNIWSTMQQCVYEIKTLTDTVTGRMKMQVRKNEVRLS